MQVPALPLAALPLRDVDLDSSGRGVRRRAASKEPGHDQPAAPGSSNSRDQEDSEALNLQNSHDLQEVETQILGRQVNRAHPLRPRPSSMATRVTSENLGIKDALASSTRACL